MRLALNLVATNILDRSDEDLNWVDGVAYRKDLPPGTGMWMRGTDNSIASLWFTCPCGCGAVTAVTVNKKYGKSSWEWDGNEEKPTVSPSILRTSGCCWHGFLKRGLFGLTENPENEAP